MAYLVFRQLVIMTLICLVSFVVARAGHFGERESKFLSYLLLYMISPAMIISTYNRDFDAERWHFFLIMFGLCFATFLIQIALSMLWGRPKDKEDDRRRSIDKVMVVYSNAGYIGIPIIQAVMGPDAVFYLMIYILVFNLVLWVHGQWLMTGAISVKAVLTKPTVISAILAILLFVSPFKLPFVVGETARILADLNTALSMIVLGIIFADFKKPESKLPVFRLALVSFVRLIAIPAFFIFLLWLLRSFFPDGTQMEVLRNILVIVVGCPAGMVSANFALLYDKDYQYASFAVAITTALCVLTLPVMVGIAEAIL